MVANRVIPDEEPEKIVSLEHQNESSRKRKKNEDHTEEEEEEEEEENGSGCEKNSDQDELNSESDQDSVSEVSEQSSQELNRKGKGRREQGSVSSTPSESNLSQVTNPINVYTLNLALPSACVNESTDKSNEPEEEEFPLAKALKETSALYKESILNSIGPKYLYTLLPRQCEIKAYKYVKEDVRIPFFFFLKKKKY